MKKLVIMCLATLAVLAVTTASVEAVVFIDDGIPHTFSDNTYELENVWLDYNTANTPGTHVDVVDGGTVDSLYAFNNSTVTMTGGTITNVLGTYGDGTVTLLGGILNGPLDARENGAIYLNGTGFTVNGTALVNGDKLSDFVSLIENGDYDHYTGIIAGTLANGTVLNNAFFIFNTGAHAGTANIYVVPEPATMCLLALGGLISRRKR